MHAFTALLVALVIGSSTLLELATMRPVLPAVREDAHAALRSVEPGPAAGIRAGAIESLSIVLAPAPPKPVGAGAYWMVTDRAPTSGAEMLRYRVFRVVSAGADGTKLSVELRQYSVETTLSVAGAGQGGGEVKLTIDKFESRGKGEVTWGPATFLPPAGEVQGQTQALVVPPGQPNQRAQVQTEVRLKLSSN